MTFSHMYFIALWSHFSIILLLSLSLSHLSPSSFQVARLYFRSTYLYVYAFMTRILDSVA